MDHPYEMDASGYPGVTQQDQLLGPGSAGYPGSGAQLADQIERGGAQIEETLSRLNCRYQSLFFIVAWVVVAAGVLSVFLSVAHLQLATLVNSIFLIVFGSMVMILDIPGSPRWAGVHRRSIRKYARFLTRMTGKALWFLYLGCMVVVCLWPTRYSKRSNLQLLFALVLSGFVVVIAFIALFVALRKSLRLERIRKHVQQSYQGNWLEVYRKYAVNDPAHGMQFEEFNRLASDFSNGRVLFDLGDLTLIFSALDDHQKSAINEIEFGNWVAAGLPGDDCGPNAATCCAPAAMTFI